MIWLSIFLNYTNAAGFMSLKVRLNHSCRSSSAAAWPHHQRGRFSFQTGSKLIAIPTTQQLSWEESGMTSHWSSAPRSLGVRDAGRLLLDLKCWSHNDQCQTATSWLIWSAIFFFFPWLSSHDTWMWDVDTYFPWKWEATCDVGLLKMCETINWKNTKGAI